MKKLYSLVLSAAALCLSALGASANETTLNPDYLFSPKGIATVRITLNDGKQIDDIKRDEKDVKAEKLSANMVIENANGSTYDDTELYNGLIKIKGRGNTSWNLPKRPYSIDLVDALGEDNPASLLGMPADEEWALVAFWTDRSYMRHPFGYFLGRMFDGINYSPRFRYVELYLNDDYRGVYMLVEKIKRSSDRVDVKKLDETKENGISGGYILEAIPYDRCKSDEVNTYFKTNRGNHGFIFKYPKPKNATQAQIDWIKAYLDKFEEVLWNNDYSEETGYRKYADPKGFYDWIILHDLSKGVDNLFHASVFVEKDRNGLIRMSAPWDFDLSWGNIGHDGDPLYEDELWIKRAGWWKRMWSDPYFAKNIEQRFDELLPLMDLAPAILWSNYTQLEETGCIRRDNERWPNMLSEFKSPMGTYKPSTSRGHIRWMLEWIESRKFWLASHYAATDADNCERLKNMRPVIRVYDPDAFENGQSMRVRGPKGFAKYIWDGGKDNEFISTNPMRTIADDREHVLQVVDEHGCVSLPSLPIQRGEPYKNSFGKSLTSGIGDITTPETAADGAPVIVATATGVRVVCPSARPGDKLTVTMTDLSGRTIARQTVDSPLGLDHTDIALPSTSTAAIVTATTTSGRSASVKIMR